VLIDSSGRVGIGTTSPTTKLDIYTDSATGTYVKVENTEGRLFAGVYGTGEGYLATETSDPLVLGTNGTERARIDTSGRLLVGTSSAGGTELIQVQGNTSSSTAPGGIALRRSSLTNTDDIGYLNWTNASGNVHAGIRAICDGTPGASDYPGALLFSTTADGASSPTERMRINSAGATKIFASTANVLGAGSNQAAGTTYYLFYGSNNASSTTTGTTCFLVFTNGNVQNTNNSYAGISDAKLKENIVDAASQWSDIKALQVRKYNFKEGQTHTQIGLIAQEVELVSPGLVTESPDRDEDGNDLGTVTKSVNYSVLYMKAVKALQEAMERIEQLETEMAAVKAQLS
jgi:hypothetical protein